MRIPPNSSWLVLPLVLFGCAPRDSVPTFEVGLRPFRHEVTAEGNLKAAKVTRLAVPQEVEQRVRLAWLAPEGRVEEGDLVARFDPTEMVDRLREGRLDHQSAELEVGKAQRQSDSKLAEFDTDFEVAHIELEHARRYQKTDNAAFSRNEVVESQIDEKLAGVRKEHAASSRTSEETRGKTELELLEIKKRQAQLKIDQAERGLAALEVRAPHGGLFTVTRGWSGEPLEAGAEMWRGQEIGEIPNLSVMEAEVFVLEADAGGLAAGKSATVIVEAYPEEPVPARISRVDAVAKPRFRGSPVQYFGVTLELAVDGGSRSAGNGGPPKKPGHRISATLLLEEREAALVVPRQAVFTQGNEHHVYVKNGDGFAVRRVEIGAKSMGLLVVTRGLEEGDVVALRVPANVEEPSPRAPLPEGEGAGG